MSEQPGSFDEVPAQLAHEDRYSVVKRLYQAIVVLVWMADDDCLWFDVLEIYRD